MTKFQNKSLISSPLKTILGSYDNQFMLTTNGVRISEEASNIFLESGTYSATKVHETMHWNQFMGTTWGYLCNIANYQRTSLCNEYNRYLDFNKILKEIEGAVINESYQIASFNRSTTLEARSFLQNWLDYTLGYNLFLDGGPEFTKYIAVKLGAGFSLATYHTTNYEYLYKKAPRENLEQLEASYTFKDFAFYKDALGNILSVTDLLEGQARASEVIYRTHNNSLLNLDVQDYILPFFNGDVYWSAFRNYSILTQCNLNTIENLQVELTKFCLIIDLALCPAIPPFNDFESYNYLSWQNVWPPTRFLMACKANKELNYKLDIYNYNDHEKYIFQLCKKLNYKPPSELFMNFLSLSAHKTDYLKCFNEKKVDPKTNFFLDYLIAVVRKFGELRAKQNGTTYISNYGLSCTGTEFVRYIIDPGNDHFWTESPFHITSNSKRLQTIFCKKEESTLYTWLLMSVMHSSFLNDYVVPGEVFSLDQLPFELAESTGKNMIDSFKKRFSCELLI